MDTTIRRAPTAISAGMLSVMFAVACSNPTERDPQPGIRFIAGAGISDTISASLERELVVEVEDSAGRRTAGVSVRFETSYGNRNGFSHPLLLLTPLENNSKQQVVLTTTDSQGRAAVRLHMGTIAGPAKVNVTTPTLGFANSADFVVKPGAPVGLNVAPSDTAVVVQGSYSLRMSLMDRAGNLSVSENASFTVQGPAASVSAGAVSGRAPGRSRVTVAASGFSGEALVSVVPSGTLLAARSDGVYTLGTDGSGYRRVVAQQGARSPRWFPGGDRFVYSVGLGHAYVSTLTGSISLLLLDPTAFAAELWAHPSRDGNWIYFGGYRASDFRGAPYRVRPDGTGLELVPGILANDATQGHPSPSPEGDRVAYFREEGSTRNTLVRILNMQTGELIADVPGGHTPVWSHGDSIAFMARNGGNFAPIHIMASDGTGRRALSTTLYDEGFDWSPDDRWIVAQNAETKLLEVVEVSTGLRVPLPFSQGLFNPSWKP